MMMQSLWSWQKEQHQKEGAPEHPKILKERSVNNSIRRYNPRTGRVAPADCRHSIRGLWPELCRNYRDAVQIPPLLLWLVFSPVPTHWLSLGKMAERWGHAKINPQTHRDLSTNSPFPLESPQVHHLKWLWPLSAWQEEGNNCNPSVGQQIAED